MATLAASAQRELIERLLDDREKSLLRLSREHSPESIAAMLPKEYPSAEAVVAKRAAIAEKLRRAAEGRAQNGTAMSLREKLVEETGVDMSAGVARVRMPALPAEPARVSETPPNGAAQASSPALPSAVSTPPRAGPAVQSIVQGSRARVLEALGDGPATKVELAERLGVPHGTLVSAITTLARRELIECVGVRPAQGKRGGQPSKVWARKAAAPAREEFEPPRERVEELDAGEIAHEIGLAEEPPAPEFPTTFAEGSFNAQTLWDSLSPERQKLLVRVVLREAVFPAVSDLLVG